MSDRQRRYLLPALALAALFILVALVGYVTKDGGSLPSSEAVGVSSAPGTRGSIISISGNTLTVQTDGGQKQFTLAGDASVEALRPATAASIATGEWLNVGAMPNSQTMFTIVGLTLIPQALLQDR
jgi:hypothetical protein